MPSIPSGFIRSFSTAYAKAFELPAVTARNARDPDQFFFDAINTARGAALTAGIQGNVVGQGAIVANTMALRTYWAGLRMNPMTSAFFDGQIKQP